jgi:predicted anti-sigma-YlaC factor YlaD
MADSPEHVTCQEVVELVTDYFDGAMSAEEAALFEQHLNFCEGCGWYVDQVRTTIAAVGRVDEADVPPPMRERLLTAFRDRRCS